MLSRLSTQSPEALPIFGLFTLALALLIANSLSFVCAIVENAFPAFYRSRSHMNGGGGSAWASLNLVSYQWKWSLHTYAAHSRSEAQLDECAKSGRGKVNMKTLIIWENLRNCVFHVTFYYLLLFLLHTKHALIVRLAPEVFLLLQRINRTRYGFFHHDRGRWKSTNERNWLLRRGVLCAMRKAPGLWIISVRHPKVI